MSENEIVSWVALSAVVPAWLFVLIYGLGSPWFKSWLGSVMFNLGLALALVLTFSVVRRFAGEFAGYMSWAFALYAYLVLTLWALVVIVIVERMRAPHARIPLKRKVRP